jgi:hypothetical protein
MARAVDKHLAAEFFLPAVGRIERGYGKDATVLGFGREDVLVEKKGDVFLRAHVRLLLGVAKFLIGARGVFRAVGELLDHFADVRVFAAPHETHGPHAHLGAAVAAKDRAVLDEGDLEAHAGGGDRAAKPP